METYQMGETRVTGGRWSAQEDDRLKQVVKEHGPKNWKVISRIAFNGSRTDVQCLHRWQKVLRPGLVKGPWTKDEDDVIINLINTYGLGNIKWSEIAAALPGRLGKQCRERWVNHLDPNLKKTPWTEQEDRILMQQQVLLGNKWRDIAAYLPGRSENSVKNRWNSARRKRKRSEAAAAAALAKSGGNRGNVPNGISMDKIMKSSMGSDVGGEKNKKRTPSNRKNQANQKTKGNAAKKQKNNRNNKQNKQFQINAQRQQLQQQQMFNAMLNGGNQSNNIGMHFGGAFNQSNNGLGYMMQGTTSPQQFLGNDFSNPQFQQAMLLGMTGIGQNGNGSLSPTFIGGTMMPMAMGNIGIGQNMNDPMQMVFQNNNTVQQQNKSVKKESEHSEKNSDDEHKDKHEKDSASDNNSGEEAKSNSADDKLSDVVKPYGTINNFVDFPGLQVIGNSLSEKQKQLLRESPTKFENGNFENSSNNSTNKSKLHKSSDFEVLGLKTLDNMPMNNEQDPDVFELFTFDDLVGDMSDLYGNGASSINKQGLGSNSCSPIPTNYGNVSPQSGVENSQSGTTTQGALNARALSPATVNALLGNMAPSS